MKNKTNLSIIVSCCCALLAIGGLVFASYYINGLTAKTAKLEEEIEGKEIKIKRIQNINKSAERTAEDRIKILNYFVGPNGAVDFVSALESTASSLNLNYVTNAIENRENDKLSAQNKQLLQISMTLSGAWRNVLKYLLYIESLPYSINIEKVELVSEGVVVSAPSTDASGKDVAKPANESRWRLNMAFSVVKIKEKK